MQAKFSSAGLESVPYSVYMSSCLSDSSSSLAEASDVVVPRLVGWGSSPGPSLTGVTSFVLPHHGRSHSTFSY